MSNLRMPPRMPPRMSPGDRPGRPEWRAGDDTDATHADARATPLGRPGGGKVCDDCGDEYAGPAYYTFHPRDCVVWKREGLRFPHEGCTGNLCPRCASDLEPDRKNDPRRLA